MANYVPLGATRRWPRDGFDDSASTSANIKPSGFSNFREGIFEYLLNHNT